MKIQEIILETPQNCFENFFDKSENVRNYDSFLKLFSKNTDKETRDFLFSNPLYRSDFPSMDWLHEFGMKKIKKNRSPIDTPLALHNILNRYLEKRGFRATRANSIFATGDYDFASSMKDFKDIMKEEKASRSVYVIFPSRNFFFTWNSKIHDFYLDDFYNSRTEIFDLFLFSFEKLARTDSFVFRKMATMFKEDVHLISAEAEKFLIPEIRKRFSEEELSWSKMKNNVEYAELLDEAFEIALKSSSTSTYRINEFIIDGLYYIIANTSSTEDAEKIIYLNEKSEYAKNFSSKNFHDAVKSGNEIMITNSHYFYIHHKFFEKYKQDILLDLEKFE
jgi:hypothetical protein